MLNGVISITSRSVRHQYLIGLDQIGSTGRSPAAPLSQLTKPPDGIGPFAMHLRSATLHGRHAARRS